MTGRPNRCLLCGGDLLYDIFGKAWCADQIDCRIAGKAIARVAELVAKADADCEECKTWVAALYRFVDAVGPRQGKSIPEDFEHAMVRLARLVAIRNAVVRWYSTGCSVNQTPLGRLIGHRELSEYRASDRSLWELAREELERHEAKPCQQPTQDAETL